ncbi:CD225/dispanin family protein [Paucihalobacter sp.]|uniref:CD225/dispanin family protein n=1 Tax=Paucihalobacter sp. TaxID=2850405 RepID=UPI002FDF2DF7
MENRPPKPPSYLALAIISTVLCCLPAGIVSIVYATKVNDAYMNEDYQGAINASKNAKTWGIVSVGIALLGWVLYVAIFGIAFLGAIANS